jgi:hypothetical protein
MTSSLLLGESEETKETKEEKKTEESSSSTVSKGFELFLSLNGYAVSLCSFSFFAFRPSLMHLLLLLLLLSASLHYCYC